MTGRASLEERARSVSGDSVKPTGGGIHPVMALSDYMPYGAPELLDGASPRMAQATFMASGLVAAIVCSLGLLIASRPVIPPPQGCGHIADDNTLRQFDILEPKPGSTPRIPRPDGAASDFRPVDKALPPIAPIEEP